MDLNTSGAKTNLTLNSTFHESSGYTAFLPSTENSLSFVYQVGPAPWGAQVDRAGSPRAGPCFNHTTVQTTPTCKWIWLNPSSQVQLPWLALAQCTLQRQTTGAVTFSHVVES